MEWIALANPSRFLALAERLLPRLAAATALAFAAGLYAAFFVAPEDYQQGASVRIMFIHVPGAWLGMLGWAIMSVAALGTLVWRHPLADVALKPAAPIGAAFTFVCLVTGALWGRPMWGTYWVWDARLTSVLVLFLMYLGLIALWRAIEDPARAARAAAVLTLVGAVNLPIINSRSIGGARCTNPHPCSESAARASTLRSSRRCWSWRWRSRCCSRRSMSRPCATRSCAGGCAPCACCRSRRHKGPDMNFGPYAAFILAAYSL